MYSNNNPYYYYYFHHHTSSHTTAFSWHIFTNLFLIKPVSEKHTLGNCSTGKTLFTENRQNKNITTSTQSKQPFYSWHYRLQRQTHVCKISWDWTYTTDIMISQRKLSHDIGTACKVCSPKLLVATQCILVQLQLQIDLCSKEILHPMIG